MSEDTCAVCRTDTYLDRHLRLLVSACGHRACEPCVSRLYAAGAAPCPVCKATLRRPHWALPVFSDTGVEREVRVRRALGAAVLRRPPEDFESERAYDDYLEAMEDLVAELAGDADVGRAGARIEALKREAAARRKADARTARTDAALEPAPVDASYEQRVLAELASARDRAASAEASFIDALSSSAHAGAAPLHAERPHAAKRRRTEAAANLPPYDPLEGVVAVAPAPESVTALLLSLSGMAKIAPLMTAGGLDPSLIAAHYLLCA